MLGEITGKFDQKRAIGYTGKGLAKTAGIKCFANWALAHVLIIGRGGP